MPEIIGLYRLLLKQKMTINQILNSSNFIRYIIVGKHIYSIENLISFIKQYRIV